MNPTELTALDQVARGSMIAALLLVLVGGYRDWWRYGSHARKRDAEFCAEIEKLEKDRDEWKKVALDLLRTAKSMAQSAEGSR